MSAKCPPDSRYTLQQQYEISRGDTLQQCPLCGRISSQDQHEPDCGDCGTERPAKKKGLVVS